jgi:DNA-binding Xre family transcriptional regulator
MRQLPIDGQGMPYPATTAAGWTAIGRTVRMARAELGWTQAKLAARTGVHQSTISRLETGVLTGLRWARFAAIIGALGDAWPPPGPPRQPRLVFGNLIR